MIKAEIHSDDHHMQHDFDATPWFKQASDEEIIALAKCGWRGDYAADVVALHTPDNEGIERVLIYVRSQDEMGFEVVVDADQAIAWVQEHRTPLAVKLRERTYDVAFTVQMRGRVTVGIGESLGQAIHDMDVPESEDCRYIDDTFERDFAELDGEPVDMDTGEIIPKEQSC